jgi:predicted nucleotidyltransferase
MPDQETLDKLRKFFAGQPVTRAYIFGSHARGDADEKSDVDIMVELDHSQPVGMEFIRMHIGLEDLQQSKVDLIPENALSKHIRPFVEKDKQLISEKSTG